MQKEAGLGRSVEQHHETGSKGFKNTWAFRKESWDFPSRGYFLSLFWFVFVVQQDGNLTTGVFLISIPGM